MTKRKQKSKINLSISVKYLTCSNSVSGGKYWTGRHCYNEVAVDEKTEVVLCSSCVARLLGPPDEKEKTKIKKPRGWQFRSKFVDSEGNVFFKGKEQPDLKGKFKPTKFDDTQTRKKVKKKKVIVDKAKIGRLKRQLKNQTDKTKKKKLEQQIKKLEKGNVE